MAQIGAFTLKDGKYTGTIRTMTINVKAQLVPNNTKANDDAPDFRLYAGGAELGAAWRQELAPSWHTLSVCMRRRPGKSARKPASVS